METSRPLLQQTTPIASAAAADDLPALIGAARRGDVAARGRLLRELQDPWYRITLGLLGGDAEAARDAAQETGLRFLRQLDSFRGDSQIRTWSLGIAINVAREMRRRNARHGGAAREVAEHQALTRAGPAPPDGALEAAERREHLHAVLGELPERQREAVILRFFEEMSVEETAKVMRCAQGTVKATVHQALRSLKQRLRMLA